jgi:hypothetical protein
MVDQASRHLFINNSCSSRRGPPLNSGHRGELRISVHWPPMPEKSNSRQTIDVISQCETSDGTSVDRGAPLVVHCPPKAHGLERAPFLKIAGC